MNYLTEYEAEVFHEICFGVNIDLDFSFVFVFGIRWFWGCFVDQ